MFIGMLVLVLFLVGCTTDYGTYPSSNIVEQDAASGNDDQGGYEPTAQQAVDEYPSISTTVSPSNPSLGETFELTISAEDDYGVKEFSWVSDKVFSNEDNAATFDCRLQQSCSHTWELIAIEEGLHQFKVSVEDSSGKTMDNILAEADVGPYPETTSVYDTESTENAPPSSLFTCGNAVCEGGESYQSCSSDCVPGSIIGTNPGNGACEPGEDADNAPNDCTVINPQCGNTVCDSGEDRFNCYYDCPNDEEDGESGSSCSTNSDCGYKQRCRSGTCETVECTSDSNCAGCRRCSDNQCVSCGYGAEGYCTC